MSATKVTIGFNSLPFELEDEHGNTIFAVMREISGGTRCEYMDFVQSKVKRDGSGEAVGMTSWKGTQTKLLSLCLFYAQLDDAGRPEEAGACWAVDKLVPEKTLKDWPDQALQFLSQQAMLLSKLTETSEQAGNG
jgi:hypothetical protein